MLKLSLVALAREHLDKATKAPSGRSASTVYGGHERVMRQTLIALTSGHALAEHDSPGEATVYVIAGRVRLVAGENSWEGREGDLLIAPPSRHALAAVEDSVILLSVGARH